MEIDRSKWAPGPWDAEPDRLDWREGGFPCFAQRNAMGAWCGYVGVPEGHWAFEKQYGVVNVDVHGGLTYSEHCQGHICHVPAPGESDNVWWLGFDTAHFCDTTPGHFGRQSWNEPLGEYRDLAYVKAQVSKMVVQLNGRSKGGFDPYAAQ